jgi:hypothetical protein
MGWQASQILSCRVIRASQWIACLLTRWIISLEQRLAHLAAQHVVFVLIQRGQLRWRRMPASRDIWATGIHAVDLTDPSFLVRLDCRGEAKIAAARFTGHDQVGDVERLTLLMCPAQSTRAIIQARRKRMVTLLAGAIAKLHTNNAHAHSSQFVAPSHIHQVSCAEKDHPPAVSMHNSGDRVLSIGRFVNK